MPVLSVQMTVTEPSVSTAASRRTSTRRSAIRCMPSASAIVMIAGKPSGTAATASETEDMNSDSQLIPRRAPSKATSATRITQTINSRCPTRLRRRCSGVVVSVT